MNRVKVFGDIAGEYDQLLADMQLHMSLVCDEDVLAACLGCVFKKYGANITSIQQCLGLTNELMR